KAEICRSHLKLILLASRDYAREHGTGYQTNVICLSNELISPVKLLCVNDDAGYRRVREKEKPPFEGAGVGWPLGATDNERYQLPDILEGLEHPRCALSNS